jgi:hypothetical protein
MSRRAGGCTTSGTVPRVETRHWERPAVLYGPQRAAKRAGERKPGMGCLDFTPARPLLYWVQRSDGVRSEHVDLGRRGGGV